MNFAKRAFLSITRRKGRALILFAVVFVLGNLIAGAISIQQATKNVEKTIKQQLGGKATIDLDFKKMEKAMTSGEPFSPEPLSIDVIQKIGESPYVKFYDYNLEVYGGGKDLKDYQPETEENGTMIGGEMTGMEFKLKGVQLASLMDFKEKKSKLVDGRVFTEEEIEKGSNVGIVSKKVAEENNLSVGDKFVYQNNVFDFSGEFDPKADPVATRETAFEIIGIFEPIAVEKKAKEDGKGEQGGNPMSAFYNTQFQNTIYIPNNAASKEQTFQMDEQAKVDPENSMNNGESYVPTFVLKSPEVTEQFKEEANPLIPDDYKLNASTDQYNSIAAPIKSMSKMSGFILVAAIGASLLIVSLVVLLFLRDRKHEFGIYLSLGEKRQRVLAQVVIEVFVVALIAISLSVFSGNYLAKGVSSSMIQSQIEAEAEKEESAAAGSTAVSIGGAPTANNLSADDVTKEYQISLSLGYIVSFYLVGLSTILLATIAPMVYLIRLNPKKIMM